MIFISWAERYRTELVRRFNFLNGPRYVFKLMIGFGSIWCVCHQSSSCRNEIMICVVLSRWANDLKSFHVFNFFNHSMDFIHRKYCSEFCRGRNVYTKLQSNFSRISIYAVFIRHLSVVKCVVVQIVSVDVRIYYHVVSKSYSLSWSFYFVFKLQTNLQCC